MNFVEQMQPIRYIRPSGIAVGKQAGTKQGALRQVLETIERHVTQVCKKHKKRVRLPALPNMQAGDREDVGILVGKVYDERIIEDF